MVQRGWVSMLKTCSGGATGWISLSAGPREQCVHHAQNVFDFRTPIDQRSDSKSITSGTTTLVVVICFPSFLGFPGRVSVRSNPRSITVPLIGGTSESVSAALGIRNIL